ncbi:MAG TPA: hypothetical protein PK028_01115 [Bacteroidales bacterium]|jgi:hypothetical protein|nr:MAG: hypothetical protein BWX51_01991 [Bacteroidetes bacterium ADurb.Bin012]HNQ59635.1 hypothetical protein [Bacteroidales bacterium]HNU21254.1 hypothetical protein [Bacteroidales bacterium]HNV16587.1 hypothetical protein [Bacteroidales bacterium]HNZ78650.1 hypothetical protein [Bacteroidales bacterium]
MKALTYSIFVLLISLFSVSSLNAQVVQINQTFSSDSIFTPFSGTAPVYSMNFSGGINLLSDSSLVWVVLIDTYGNHFLVFESYPLITLENAFDTLWASDETTYPGAGARNILIASDLLDYHEPIVSETKMKSSWRDRFYWTYTRPIMSDLKFFLILQKII